VGRGRSCLVMFSHARRFVVRFAEQFVGQSHAGAPGVREADLSGADRGRAVLGGKIASRLPGAGRSSCSGEVGR
jgi:hypothetical protein